MPPVRFINTETYELTNRAEPYPEYAILSHRWITDVGKSEITFSDIKQGSRELVSLSLDPRRRSRSEEHSDSMNKIIDACVKAKAMNLHWLWIDTCCTRQDNPSEVEESINSMFTWYNEATVCYAILADVRWSGSRDDPFKIISDDRAPTNETRAYRTHAEWFERGWTLQELLAPKRMEFYDRDWRRMGTKQELAGQIEQLTGIGRDYIKSVTPLRTIKEASVATRMGWMAGRHTTRPEDIAYSLVGILDIQFKPSYGEGNSAFVRLEERLLETSTDESIFAWRRPPGSQMTCFKTPVARQPGEFNIPMFSKSRWGLLAPSPDCFRGSNQIVTTGRTVERLGGGYRRTNQGVQFHASLKSGSDATNWLGLPRSKVRWPLNCWAEKDGRKQTVVLSLVKAGDYYMREVTDKVDVDPKAKVADNKVMGIDQQITKSLVVKQPRLSEISL